MAFVSGVLVALVVLILAPAAVADFHLECHMLPVEECAFAVAYSGHRCVLEKVIGSNTHVCQTSDISVGEKALLEYIESNACIQACGVQRMTIGFSTDDLGSASFTAKLCSSECRDHCANLVDLYSNIVAGEGVTLSELCGEHRRAMLIENNRILISFADAPTSGLVEAPLPM